MFNNIGRKIKGLAKVLFWIVVIAGVICGFLIMITGFSGSGNSNDKIGGFIVGILVIGFSVLLAWLQNFLLYGYGELIDCSQKILRILENESMGDSTYSSATVVRQPESMAPPVNNQVSLQSINKAPQEQVGPNNQ